MRHLNRGRRLGRTGEHRIATGRNLAASLFKQFGMPNREYIVTTLAKAKEYRSVIERLITIAKEATDPATKPERKLALRRRAASMLGPAAKVKIDIGAGEKKRVDLVRKLFDEIAPRYRERKGGYLRVIKTGSHRLGNASQKVLLAFVAGAAPAPAAPAAAAAAGEPAKS
jgi:large subunit ribosomal protein L17